jgi:hypothetical protein
VLIDSLIGVLVELAPQQPFITSRDVSFPDSVAGKNLYAANSMIKRDIAYDFCTRYTDVSTEINDTYGGQYIGSQDNWNIMVTKSAQNTNLQLIQVIPEDRIFKITVRDTANLAYQKNPMVFNLDDFFSTSGINETNAANKLSLSLYPNPVVNKLHIELNDNVKNARFEISDITGRIKYCSALKAKVDVNLSGFTSGVYLIKVFSDKSVLIRKFIKL